MTEEKILYIAKDTGKYIESTEVLKHNDNLFNLLYDMVHVKKYLTWEQKGDSKGWSCHSYKITNLGLLRLSLYRFSYAIKNDAALEEKRLTELKELIMMYPDDAKNLKPILSKKSRKFFNKAMEIG